MHGMALLVWRESETHSMGNVSITPRLPLQQEVKFKKTGLKKKKTLSDMTQTKKKLRRSSAACWALTLSVSLLLPFPFLQDSNKRMALWHYEPLTGELYYFYKVCLQVLERIRTHSHLAQLFCTMLKQEYPPLPSPLLPCTHIAPV